MRVRGHSRSTVPSWNVFLSVLVVNAGSFLDASFGYDGSRLRPTIHIPRNTMQSVGASFRHVLTTRTAYVNRRRVYKQEAEEMFSESLTSVYNTSSTRRTILAVVGFAVKGKLPSATGFNMHAPH